MRTASEPDSESLMQLDADSAELLDQLGDLPDERGINTTNITNNTNIISTTNNTNITNTTNIANTTGVANTTSVTNTTDIANTTNIANTTDINSDDNNNKDIKECRILDLLIKEVEEDKLTNKFRPAYLFIYILTG